MNILGDLFVLLSLSMEVLTCICIEFIKPDISESLSLQVPSQSTFSVDDDDISIFTDTDTEDELFLSSDITLCGPGTPEKQGNLTSPVKVLVFSPILVGYALVSPPVHPAGKYPLASPPVNKTHHPSITPIDLPLPAEDSSPIFLGLGLVNLRDSWAKEVKSLALNSKGVSVPTRVPSQLIKTETNYIAALETLWELKSDKDIWASRWAPRSAKLWAGSVVQGASNYSNNVDSAFDILWNIQSNNGVKASIWAENDMCTSLTPPGSPAPCNNDLVTESTTPSGSPVPSLAVPVHNPPRTYPLCGSISYTPSGSPTLCTEYIFVESATPGNPAYSRAVNPPQAYPLPGDIHTSYIPPNNPGPHTKVLITQVLTPMAIAHTDGLVTKSATPPGSPTHFPAVPVRSPPRTCPVYGGVHASMWSPSAPANARATSNSRYPHIGGVRGCVL